MLLRQGEPKTWNRGGHLVLYTPLLFLAVTFLIPLLLTFVWSLWVRNGFWMEPAIDFGAYREFFSGARLTVLRRSIGVAVGITTISVVIAYPISYYLAFRARPNTTRLVLVLFAIPFLISHIIRSLSWVSLLGRGGTVNDVLMSIGLVSAPLDWLLYSGFSVGLGLLTSYMPFMIFPIWLALAGIDHRLAEASWMLGAHPRRTFWTVILPLSMPGVVAAMIFVFVSSFGDSTVAEILGGPGYEFVGQSVASSLNALNYPLSAAISSIVVATMAMLVVIWYALFDIDAFLGKISRWRG